MGYEKDSGWLEKSKARVMGLWVCRLLHNKSDLKDGVATTEDARAYLSKVRIRSLKESLNSWEPYWSDVCTEVPDTSGKIFVSIAPGLHTVNQALQLITGWSEALKGRRFDEYKMLAKSFGAMSA